MDRAYSSVIGAPPTITFTRSRSPAFSIASITVFIAVTILGCPLPRGHPLTSKSQPRPSSPSWRLQCVGHHRQFRHTPSREGYAREQWSLRQPPDAGAARSPPDPGGSGRLFSICVATIAGKIEVEQLANLSGERGGVRFRC